MTITTAKTIRYAITILILFFIIIYLNISNILNKKEIVNIRTENDFLHYKIETINTNEELMERILGKQISFNNNSNKILNRTLLSMKEKHKILILPGVNAKKTDYINTIIYYQKFIKNEFLGSRIDLITVFHNKYEKYVKETMEALQSEVIILLDPQYELLRRIKLPISRVGVLFLDDKYTCLFTCIIDLDNVTRNDYFSKIIRNYIKDSRL